MKYLRYVNAAWVSLLLMSATPVWAENAAATQGEQLSVTLSNLQKIQQEEKAGDELYISVTEYAGKETPRFYQVPPYPAHWTSHHVTGIKDVVLWKKAMKACEPTTVLFSLVEEDAYPWDPDDLLGSVQLNLTCDNGQMKTAWSIPNAAITVPLKNNPSGFVFKGHHTEYNAILNVVKQKSPILNDNTNKAPAVQERERLIFP